MPSYADELRRLRGEQLPEPVVSQRIPVMDRNAEDAGRWRLLQAERLLRGAGWIEQPDRSWEPPS